MIAALVAAAALTWHSNPPLPVARTEVASTNWRGRVVVAAGFTGDTRASAGSTPAIRGPGRGGGCPNSRSR